MTGNPPGQPHWCGEWVRDHVGIHLSDEAAAPAELPLTALVGLALRHNPRRAHLLVSTVLGKHIPTDPDLVYGAGRLLGALVADCLVGCRGETTRNGRRLLAAALSGQPLAGRQLVELCERHPSPEPAGAAVVLGFAETATALGHCVAQSLSATYLHSTRRAGTGVASVAGFDEEHSHAVAHLLLPFDSNLLAGTGPLVLVDDELSTGQTAMNTIRVLHGRHRRPRYVIASLVDLRTALDRDRMTLLAAELGVRIDVICLAAGLVELPADVLARAAVQLAQITGTDSPRKGGGGSITRVPVRWPDALPEGGRHGITASQTSALDAAAREVAGAVAGAAVAAAGACAGWRVLVLGTEELMFAPLRVAGHLGELLPGVDIRFSATTRSPVHAVDDPGYAVRTAVRFPGLDDNTDRFAYNVQCADRWDALVLVIDTVSDTSELHEGLLARLAEHAAHVYLVVLPAMVHPRPTARAGRTTPEPLVGPEFGSYRPQDVRWLLTDLSDAELEAPTEDREEAIQAGAAHYAQSLPIEYQPSEQYQALFESSLTASARRIARAVGIVTEIVLCERGDDAVLASLARAGTPIGVLMRRWAAFTHGLDIAHYALSIVRGRGLDEVALRYLAQHHNPESVVFVDGWTGKGAIVRELADAIERVDPTLGRSFNPEVAVLADPGSCVRTFGTREDFLIPSACLNSTVSGLVSRTVLHDQLIGVDQFHGAKFYAELAPTDQSATFIDAITSQFEAVAGDVAEQWKRHADADRRPTWSGWAAVEAISARYGIGDVNLVKPGVGETTRVLLRRVPWKILVNSDSRAELAHIEILAAERGVDIEEVAGLAYSCVGLIHPQFTKGATGADGRAARR